MSRATVFVLGYHGCDREIGYQIIRGELPFTHSEKTYDWLGHGFIFGSLIAGALWNGRNGRTRLGSVLILSSLAQCLTSDLLDLLERENLDLLAEIYQAYAKFKKRQAFPFR